VTRTLPPSRIPRPPRVLVTLPVRDEAPRLIAALEAVDNAFRTSGLDYRLSVAEDGSTDGTKKMLPAIASRFPGLLVQEADSALGRGRALRSLWSQSHFDIYCFTDTDLAAGEQALVAAVEKIHEGADIVTGSRYAPGAHTARPPVRELVSRIYNLMLRLAFNENITDHQCGLKAFSLDAIARLLPHSQEDSWFWDTEMLVLGLTAGYPIVEMPVTWTERKTQRTIWRRLASDVYLHGTGLIRLLRRVRTASLLLPAAPGAVVSPIRKNSSLEAIQELNNLTGGDATRSTSPKSRTVPERFGPMYTNKPGTSTSRTRLPGIDRGESGTDRLSGNFSSREAEPASP
jgi:hypothetical protein